MIALVGGLITAAVRAVVDFDHGIWLVAYLLLVGFLAPALIGWGRTALLGSRSRDQETVAEAALWAVGTVAVPVGVLGGSRLAVIAGSVALLVALRHMAAPALDPTIRSQTRPLAFAYLVLLGALVVSVGIGVGLAWDTPWL